MFFFFFFLLFIFSSSLPSKVSLPTSEVPVQHSLDGGSTWSQKGKLLFKSAIATDFTFQPAFADWSDKDLESLVNISKQGKLYFIRIPQSTDVDFVSVSSSQTDSSSSSSSSIPSNEVNVDDEDKYVSIAVAPCVLFNTKFQEEYVVYINILTSEVAVEATTTNKRIAIGIQSMTQKIKPSFTRNFCGLYSVPAKPLSIVEGVESNPQESVPTKVSAASFESFKRHRAIFKLAKPAKLPAVSLEEYLKAAGAPPQPQQQQAPRGDGKDGMQPPPQEKSFIQKYWVWILLAVVFFSFQGAGGGQQPPPPPAGGAPSTTTAKPAAVRKN